MCRRAATSLLAIIFSLQSPTNMVFLHMSALAGVRACVRVCTRVYAPLVPFCLYSLHNVSLVCLHNLCEHVFCSALQWEADFNLRVGGILYLGCVYCSLSGANMLTADANRLTVTGFDALTARLCSCKPCHPAATAAPSWHSQHRKPCNSAASTDWLIT